MKESWKSVVLAEICDVKHGFAFDGADFSNEVPEGNPLVVTPGNFTEDGNLIFSEKNSKRFLGREPAGFRFDVGELLVVMTDLSSKMKILGKPAFVESEGLLHNQRIGRVVFMKDGVDRRYVYYFMMSEEYLKNIRRTATGTMVKHTAPKRILGSRLMLPPLAEQQRIVSILDEAFAGIATAKATAEKNLKNARELFESHLQSVFTQRGEEWVERRFADVCEISSVLVDPRKKEYADMLHVGGANIASKTGELIELQSAREEGLISGKFVFEASAVLYSKIRPYLMKVARPEFRGLCSADIYPLSPNPRQINRDYLFHLLLSPEFTDYANAGSARAGMPKVNRDHLFAFKLFLPPMDKQIEKAAELDRLLVETQRLACIYQKKIEALESLKKSLLHQAFSASL